MDCLEMFKDLAITVTDDPVLSMFRITSRSTDCLDEQMPLVLAGLLDAVSTALANLATVRLGELP